MASRLSTGRVPADFATCLLASVAALALMTGPAFAQPEDLDAETEVEELVVSGVRTRPGQVVGDIAPEVSLSQRQIRAYGAANVSELLDALAPQTTSGQGGGRPVVLINGGRVSGFAEVRDLPTEAIARVDILPEEVSLKYGYPAEQKVVNFVLRQRFNARLAEATGTVPTAGAGATEAGHASVLRILRGQRLMLDAKATHTAFILESDRNVTGGDGALRSLQPRTTDVVINAVLARPLGSGVSGTLNGTFQSTDTLARIGPTRSGVAALTRRTHAEDASIAASANGALAGWQWSYTGQVARNVARSTTERDLAGLAYTDSARTAAVSAQSDIVLSRALWRLPAGEVASTFTARASKVALDSDARRAGVTQSGDLDRSIGQLQASFDIPLLRDGDGGGATLGKLSGNFNAGVQHLSDFGDLQTLGYGLNWTPIRALRVLASFSRTDQAPSINQLGDPLQATPQVRIFDLRRGQTTEVTRLTGGSRDLGAGTRDVIKLGATYKPFDKINLSFQANYVSTRVQDAVVAFPSASTQVEDAFPDRFARNADGVLIQIDARPVNFTSQSRDELRWGFTYSRRLGPQPTPDQLAATRRRFQEERAAREAQAGVGTAPAAAGQPGAGSAAPSVAQPDRSPPGQGPAAGAERPQSDGPGARSPGGGRSGFGGGRGGGFGGFGGGQRGGVFQLGLYHTLVFRDDVLIRPTLPKLDLLDGAALGSGGGSPRNQVDLQTNYSRAGLGAALNAKWQSATQVNSLGAAGGGGQNLEFSDLTTVNLRLFADLGQQPIARKHRWLRGARVTLAVENLFDARQRVRTGDSLTPISYQPDLLDPVGRSVRLTLRKLFF